MIPGEGIQGIERRKEAGERRRFGSKRGLRFSKPRNEKFKPSRRLRFFMEQRAADRRKGRER